VSFSAFVAVGDKVSGLSFLMTHMRAHLVIIIATVESGILSENKVAFLVLSSVKAVYYVFEKLSSIVIKLNFNFYYNCA